MLLLPGEIQSIQQAGGKGFRLKQLADLGLRVPPFVIIPNDFLFTELQNCENPAEIIKNKVFPEGWKNKLATFFPGAKEKYFAVRSSGVNEDGLQFSFAGQFKTKLFVSFEGIDEAVKEVLLSAYSDPIRVYSQQHKMNAPHSMAVVIQEMVEAEISGVAFGINPVSGNENEKIISSVFGLGEGIVSGELDADHFVMKENEIEKKAAEKTYGLFHSGNGKIEKRNISSENQKAFTLNDDQLKEISSVLGRLHKELGCAQDIEFSYCKNIFYLLQTRPVTSSGKKKDNSQYIVWDNSNIIESYPGVTTPLTFSFILSSYESAYRLFSEYLGVDKKTIEQNREVYANTLGLINGRVYYNLKSWYHMLALLPGYSVNARYMEKMMGVKEKFDIPESYRISKSKAWLRIFKMAFRMYGRYLSMRKNRKKFYDLLNEVISSYKSINYDNKTAAEIIQLYIDFEKKLLCEWKAPLLNDFFAMIAFGRLQKKCDTLKLNSENPNIHNDLLCGSSDIISTQPIHRTISIASFIINDQELKSFFCGHNEKEIWQHLLKGKYPQLKKKIDAYIHDFGERCVGELKLETVSYSSEPSRYVKVIKSYVEENIVTTTLSGSMEEKLRKNAEEKVKDKLRLRPLRYYFFTKTLSKARELVSHRENLRYERTRAFGIVRELFIQTGKKFKTLHLIENEHDIFYLTKEEIISFSKGTSVNSDLRFLIALRKKEFDRYTSLPVPAERIKTYGLVYENNDFYEHETFSSGSNTLKGTGCCPGIVRGKVRIVRDPSEISSLNGDILVTSSTDPGWVTLFPSASAIIVERGSLLSHSAIVSREMGIPCIVSVTGLLKTLKTGDEIEMNGNTGEITLLNIS